MLNRVFVPRRVFVSVIAAPLRSFCHTPRALAVERYYSDSHEWIDFDTEAKTAVIGISSHAQESLGEVVYAGCTVNMNDKVQKTQTIGEVESVKATNDIYSPVDGTVVAVNERVSQNPSLVNKSAEKDGWFVKLSDVEIDPKRLVTAETMDKELIKAAEERAGSEEEGGLLMTKEQYTNFLDSIFTEEGGEEHKENGCSSCKH